MNKEEYLAFGKNKSHEKIRKINNIKEENNTIGTFLSLVIINIIFFESSYKNFFIYNFINFFSLNLMKRILYIIINSFYFLKI